MKFQVWVASMMMWVLAACGHEGQPCHGAPEYEGVDALDTQALAEPEPEPTPEHDDPVPVITTGPDVKLTTDEEDAYSREMGEKMIAEYRARHPEEFQDERAEQP